MHVMFPDDVKKQRRNARLLDDSNRHSGVDSISGKSSTLRTGDGSIVGREEVLGHELVYGELLIGDSGGRRKFLSLTSAYRRPAQFRIRKW